MKKYQESLETEKISKLLLRQSVPAMIGLVVMSLYNVVDTIFIGHGAGTLAIAGLTIAFPIQMIIMAMAQTIGIGASSLISIALGAKDFQKAEKALGNFFSLTLIVSLIVMALGFVFLVPILKAFGATSSLLPFAKDYLQIILLGTFFISLALGGNFVIRAEGNAKYAMGIMISSAVVNIILDPIFIFGFDMGLKGAAIATVIAQFVAAFAAFMYFVTGRSGVYIHLKYFKLHLKTVKDIFSIGISSFARQASASVMAAIMNHSLGLYGGEIAIAAFGIINRMLMIVLMPIFGIIQGMQPILGFNYGAKKFLRARESIMLSIKAATLISSVAFILLMIFPKQISMIFSSDDELISMSSSAVRLIILMLPVVGFQIVGGGIYQSIGKAMPAFILSVLRQILFLIPLVLILPIFFGLEGIWMSFPLSDLLAFIVTFFMITKELKYLQKS